MLKVRSSAVDLSPVIDHYTLMFKNTFRSFTGLLLVFFLFASNVVAQSEECGFDHPELCNFDVALFCQRQGDVNLNFALDIDSNSPTFASTIFSVTFDKKPPVSNLPLFFLDGEVEAGNVNETRVTTLKCNGTTCSGVLTVERLEALQTEFDFDQAVITFVLRKGSKFGYDFCIGKFTNEPDLLAANDSSTRQICTLNTTTGFEDVISTGFFSPGGYGTDGEARFHLSVEGLDTNTKYKACSVVGENRYSRVFDFNSYLLATADDDTIYGSLSTKEQAEFNANRSLYSYELRSQLSTSSTSLRNGNTPRLFTPSLSLINKSVSSSSASSTVRASNKVTRLQRRRDRLRKQKNQSSRSFSVASLRSANVGVSAKVPKQELGGWLNFDPLGGTLVVSTSCSKNVLENSIGTLVCGNDAEDDFRRCRFFTFPSGDTEATVCRVIKDGVGQLVFRVKDSVERTLTPCINGAADSNLLNVIVNTPDPVTQYFPPSFPFAELQLTDSDTLASGDSSFVKVGFSISDVTSVALSETNDCSSPLSSVTF